MTSSLAVVSFVAGPASGPLDHCRGTLPIWTPSLVGPVVQPTALAACAKLLTPRARLQHGCANGAWRYGWQESRSSSFDFFFFLLIVR
jgi:hypothetical protein